MMTHPVDIGLPPGADAEMSERQFEDYDGVLARLVWSPEMPLPEHLAARNIALAVAQRQMDRSSPITLTWRQPSMSLTPATRSLMPAQLPKR
ncbi:Uncharacterised protein [Mycobacteroides abscessus]|nr:Uncharacterised protein [Mycobacteroides abscessus]